MSGALENSLEEPSERSAAVKPKTIGPEAGQLPSIAIARFEVAVGFWQPQCQSFGKRLGPRKISSFVTLSPSRMAFLIALIPAGIMPILLTCASMAATFSITSAPRNGYRSRYSLRKATSPRSSTTTSPKGFCEETT